MRWPWNQRPPVQVDEPDAHIDRLRAQQPEVNQLTSELRPYARSGFFTRQVALALFGRKPNASNGR